MRDLGKARTTAERAHELMEKVVTGAYSSETREAAVTAEAKALYAEALAVFEAENDAAGTADVCEGLGYLALHGEEDAAAAEPLLLRAARIHEERGDRNGHLAALLELNAIDAHHPAVDRAVAEAVAAGLPDDLDPRADPLHLVAARRDARDQDSAHALAEALLEDATRRGDQARAARVLVELGTIADERGDRRAAREHFEASLAMAEAAGSNEQTLRALLHLVDSYWTSGDKARARETFARAEKIRGVPESLRTLRRITAMALR